MDGLNENGFPYPIMSADALKGLIGRNNLRIVDASWRMPGEEHARRDHEIRRLPGAVFFDLDDIADKTSDLPHMLPSPQDFAAAVGDLGISDNDDVVVYDDKGLFSAARVWWTFRAMGHDKVSVLDGGLAAWECAGGPTEKGAATPTPTRYDIGIARVLARNANEVGEFLKRKDGIVLDARPTPRFEGAASEPRPGLRSGAMPGAVNLPLAELLTPNGRLKPVAELARLFHDRGVHMETPVITTCGSGVTAAALSLALERLSHQNHAVYDGSWAEWGRETNDPAIFPVVKGKS